MQQQLRRWIIVWKTKSRRKNLRNAIESTCSIVKVCETVKKPWWMSCLLPFSPQQYAQHCTFSDWLHINLSVDKVCNYSVLTNFTVERRSIRVKLPYISHRFDDCDLNIDILQWCYKYVNLENNFVCAFAFEDSQKRKHETICRYNCCCYYFSSSDGMLLYYDVAFTNKKFPTCARTTLVCARHTNTCLTERKLKLKKYYPLVGNFVTENHVMFMKQFVICIQF